MNGFATTKYFVDSTHIFESFVEAYNFANGKKSRITSNSCYYDFETLFDYFFN